MLSVANAPNEVSTPRLLLRKPRPDDAHALFAAYTSDVEVVRFLTWRAHKTEEETLGFLRHCLEEWSNGTGYPYVIEVADLKSGPVGMIHSRVRAHEMQFGYVLARPYWGKGYMTEALKTVADWSLSRPATWRASAFCDVENIASARVMEKAGLTFEGILRRFFVHPNVSPEPRDCKVYSRVRA
jgi:RimJ/RimL family protein N-acetyltransferase